ncbi:TPM domain-containing protein [Winogradskyella endarachnes]|uniref:TPM domain-containing protein n=1 Tax=Winogradskyella endarachnes TaxID=2681965 RepID=A0A6L6UCN3_9FLAO|nr:TPM domain-containing protein [Winogradskyella endarachnes]MUU79729.1 TPM domain-containing protein [Winogradskyella endarachnes]
MSKLEDFLSTKDEERIVEAIRNAEKNTSGEIRVHIEKHCESDIFEHAVEVFYNLKMDNTREQNGVLIYVAVENKSFVIYGDTAINAVVDKNFWNSTRDIIASHFKTGNFSEGLIKGIEQAGRELSTHFPWQQEDTNELDNTISKG